VRECRGEVVVEMSQPRRSMAALLLLLFAMFALAGCFSTRATGVRPPQLPCDHDERLVGTWRTGVHMSQLGPGLERVTYHCDCTFKARSTVLLLVLPISGTETGWYTASDGKLATDVGYGRLESGYHFEDETLVVQQGTSVTRYHSVSRRSCAGGRAEAPRDAKSKRT
jgi:hypothetical protein